MNFIIRFGHSCIDEEGSFVIFAVPGKSLNDLTGVENIQSFFNAHVRNLHFPGGLKWMISQLEFPELMKNKIKIYRADLLICEMARNFPVRTQIERFRDQISENLYGESGDRNWLNLVILGGLYTIATNSRLLRQIGHGRPRAQTRIHGQPPV